MPFVPPVHEPLNPREFLILLALADGVQHGYAILKAVESESDGEVRFDPANLYRLLRRLERDGLVSEAGTEDGDGGRRRLFALTAEGRRLVRAEARRVDRLAARLRERRLISGRRP